MSSKATGGTGKSDNASDGKPAADKEATDKSTRTATDAGKAGEVIDRSKDGK